SQALMTSDKGFDMWLSYMNAWYNLNIDHVQFNVVSTEEMKEAQEKPEEHEDLIVRIAGFSSKFNNLTEYTQDSIIARTEQELG
ncbi:MAG: glycine radical domain-containing protein, partial [Carboxydocellales bacterium]